jgi:hypothetical protein
MIDDLGRGLGGLGTNFLSVEFLFCSSQFFYSKGKTGSEVPRAFFQNEKGGDKASNEGFKALNLSFEASSVTFETSNESFEASSIPFEASDKGFEASNKSFEASYATFEASFTCFQASKESFEFGLWDWLIQKGRF